MLISEFLDLSAMLVPDRTAIAFEGKRYSFAQLKERVNRLADALNKLGLKKGDRTAIFEVNCPEYIEALSASTAFKNLPAEVQDELVQVSYVSQILKSFVRHFICSRKQQNL